MNAPEAVRLYLKGLKLSLMHFHTLFIVKVNLHLCSCSNEVVRTVEVGWIEIIQHDQLELSSSSVETV